MSDAKAAGCIVCSQPVRQGYSAWHYVCDGCGYEGAQLAPAINESSAHAQLDEGQREQALKQLRQLTFRQLVQRALQHRRGTRLLDVGCAHGWFLEEAARHFEVLGIEPDEAVCRKTVARGLNARAGYFPQALAGDERFDVIVFNDVIEHIPQIGDALDAVRGHLNPGGILILNLPNSGGFFYRLSKLLHRAGLAGPFERMWQKGLPSPHVHYFNKANLEALVQRRGFDTVDQFELPSVVREGLLERIRCVGNASALSSYLQYLAIRTALPVLKLFQSDIIVLIFRKRD